MHHAPHALVIRFPLLVALAGGAAAFAAPPLHHGESTASVGGDLVVGDFDRDGRQDLAVVVRPNVLTGERWLALRRGDGFGGFSEFGTQHALGVAFGELPALLAVVDLDQDGNSEVVWQRKPSQGSFHLEVVEHVPGSGFHVLAAFDGEGIGTPREAAAADLDGDLDLDLVVTFDNGNLLGIARQVGGAFPVLGRVEPASTLALALGDVDGDGDTDVLAGAAYSPELYLVRNAGGGTFASPITLTLPTGGTPSSLVRPVAVDLDDVDGDGALDVLAAWTGAGVASYLGDGAGGFSFHAAALQSVLARDAVFTDLDHDGRTDALAVGSRGIASATIDAGGGFAVLHAPAGGPLEPGWVAHTRVEAAHLDGDGEVDAWTAKALNGSANDAEVFAHLALGPGSFAASGGPRVLGADAIAVAAADFDQDGDVDVARVFLADSTLRLARNDGGGVFAEVSVTPTANAVNEMRAADLDGDGYPELVVRPFGQASLWVHANTGGAFGAAQQVTAPSGIGILHHMALGDVDGDGDVDAVGACMNTAGFGGFAMFVNAGGSLMPGPLVPFAQLEASGVELQDADGDGRLDLVVEGVDPVATITVLPNRSVPGTIQFGAPQVVPTPGGSIAVAGGDLDGDGKAELVACGRLATAPGAAPVFGVRAYATGPGPTLMPLAFSPSLVPHAPRSLVLADVDADGKLDAVTESERMVVHRGDGAGGFAAGEGFLAGLDPHTVLPMQQDADPELEVVYFHWQDQVLRTLDPLCPGRAGRFGHGCIGSNGRVPSLSLAGCLRAGETVTFSVRDALPNALGLLAFGLAPAPSLGGGACTLQVAPLLGAFLVLPLPATAQGTGALELPVTFPASPTLKGVHFAEQVFCADPGSPYGYTVTNGLEFAGG